MRRYTLSKSGKVWLANFISPSVQTSYFMLSDVERTILDTALEKYRPGQSEPF